MFNHQYNIIINFWFDKTRFLKTDFNNKLFKKKQTVTNSNYINTKKIKVLGNV